MKILFFGDIIGKSGRGAIRQILPQLKEAERPDFVVANVENAAHGKGITHRIVAALLESGIDFLTSGNHIFAKPDYKKVFADFPDKIIRPANFPEDLAGGGYKIITANKTPVLLINLNGQVFMERQFDEGEISNPFLTLDKILDEAGKKATVRILDFHAEATSEKRAMGFYADGRLSAVLGTHTHVQSADAQILPLGTGYITDLGMVGAKDSIIGVERDAALKRFLVGEGSPKVGPLLVDEGTNYEIGYCILEIDVSTGRCQNIKANLVCL